MRVHVPSLKEEVADLRELLVVLCALCGGHRGRTERKRAVTDHHKWVVAPLLEERGIEKASVLGGLPDPPG
eukprot:5909392-Alexandrium_andersonii.AAC.1